MAAPCRASDDRLEQLQALADTMAAMPTDAELEGDMSGDDAAETLACLIAWARMLSTARPAIAGLKVVGFTPDPVRPFDSLWRHIQSKPLPDPDAYPMGDGWSAKGGCRPCKGTGEIIEYPADDDERFVTCPACGGTGERPLDD